jgi:acetyl esterase
MRAFWRNYLNGPADLANPLACPMQADVHGLPPAFVAVADCDILLEENVVLGKRLENAGVPVRTVVYPGTTHSFLEAVSIAKVSDRALAESSAWLSETLLAS